MTVPGELESALASAVQRVGDFQAAMKQAAQDKRTGTEGQSSSTVAGPTEMDNGTRTTQG